MDDRDVTGPDPLERAGAGAAAGRGGYAFGDTEVAGDRLALLDAVFGPSSSALLAECAPVGVELAVDLGCGLGWTTERVGRACRPGRLVGLDASASFVARARARVGERVGATAVSFAVHDVTAVPFPTGPAGLIFARYLLAHLAEPRAVVAAWTSQLGEAGARLLLDEVEHIDIVRPVFATYLDLAGRLLAARGNELYVGRALAGLPAPPGTAVVADRTATISPTTGDAARLFAMNLATWRHDPWVAANVPAVEVDRLAAELDELLTSMTTGEITWTHRQLAIERRR